MALSQSSIRVRQLLTMTAVTAMMAGATAPTAATAGIIADLAAVKTADATTNPQSQISQSTEKVAKESFISKVGNRIGSLDIRLKLKLLDIDYLDGLKTALDYKYELEPSYTGEYHLRMDRIRLNTDVNVGELLNRTNDYAGLNLKHGTEFLFVRPHPSKLEAAKAFPFGFKKVPTSASEILERLPLDAKNVVEHMQQGDFYSFRAHLDMVVGVSSLPITDSLPVQAFTHYLLSGEYQIYLVKGKNQHVFVKIVALRKDEKGGGYRVGLPAGHKIFGLRVVDRRIEAITNITEIFSMTMTKTKSNLLMVNYELDMKEPRVAAAYNGLVASILKFKTLKIANPWSSNKELQDKLISDVTPIETIFDEEKSKPYAQRAVDRKFKGKNDVDESDRSTFKIAPLIFKYTKQTEYFENMLTSTDANEAREFYRLHTFQRTNEISWWFSYYKGTSVSRASLLFDSNEKLEIGTVRDIAFEWNYRDKALTAKELRMLKDAVRQALPANIHTTIDWGAFKHEQEYANARFSYKMLLNENALARVGSLNSGEIFNLLNVYIKTIPEPSALPVNMGQAGDAEGGARKQTLEEKYQDTFLNIAHHLGVVFQHDPQLKGQAQLDENQRRSKAFAELRFNDLFIEIGPGFLLSLLPQNELKKLASFEVTLVADDVPAMTPFRFGTFPDRKVYQAAALIQSILTQNEFETITQMMKDADPNGK